jgi:hypothetical protein
MNRLVPHGRHRATLMALLCAQLLSATSGALALDISPAGPHWPPPAKPSAPDPQDFARSALPNFEAPSATHCARPVRTVEVPGRSRPQPHGDDITDSDERASVKRSGGSRSASKAKGDAEARAEVKSLDPAAGPAAAAPPAPAADMKAPEVGERAAESVPAAAPGNAQAQAASVTAGMVDDNADFASYLQFRRKNASVPHRERDVRERYLLQVRTSAGHPVPDAEVAVRAPDGATLWARTDSGGRAWLHPLAVDPQGSAKYQVVVRREGQQAQGVLTRGQKSAVDIVIDAPAPQPKARLDLVFLVDATGSMDDEIAKLRASLRSIADQLASLPSQPDLCFGLVAYRDQDDAFLLRRHNLSNDLSGFQAALNALQADGGGDYPEAMNEALHDTVHQIDWRGDGTTRLVVLLADAPPHLNAGGPQYDQDMLAALGKGIKVFSVGASGLNKQGEYVQRQIAQYTGGRFVFLTYQDAGNPGRGPGRETVHDVRNYSVQTLDKLIVRLVSEELEKLPQNQE